MTKLKVMEEHEIHENPFVEELHKNGIMNVA